MKLEMFPGITDTTKMINVKFGIDPTFPRLHLGHLVPLRIVKKMQEQSRKVTIVLGTFTAQMGDPSGKDKTRPILFKDEVEANAEAILNQVNKILLPGFSVFRNGDIFNKMTVPELLSVVSKFTTQQLLSRDAFQKRIQENKSIGIHELIVPILQGLDSVHLKSEIEIGGTDQLFNFGIARRLQELNNQTPEICFLVPIINGTDGQKMSKSLDNCIFLDEDPINVFGKCMSISDGVMNEWIPLLTDLKKLDESPMNRKKSMSFDIVKQLFDEEIARKVLDNFENTIQNKELPKDMPKIQAGDLIDIIVQIRGCSKSEARRLLNGGAVTVDGFKVIESAPFNNVVVKVGKRHFGLVE